MGEKREDKKLAKLVKWAGKLEKKHRRVVKRINALNVEYDKFFAEYSKVVPLLDEIESEQASLLLDDLRNTFDLDI